MGGCNDAGLACDAVLNWDEKWDPDLSVPNVWGDAIPQVLQKCRTVEDAVAFFKSHRDPMFNMLKILVADKSGASIIFGAHDGMLQVERVNQHWRGFGYGIEKLKSELPKNNAPTVANGFRILQACAKQGVSSTRYSNIFDLNSGDIFLRPALDGAEAPKLNLANELAKGAHYYDLASLRTQLTEAPRALLPSMMPPQLDDAKTLPDEPTISARVKSIVQGIANSAPNPDDFTTEMQLLTLSVLKQTSPQYRSFGALISLTPTEKTEEDGRRFYYYRLEFEHATVLHKFVFDAQNKVTFASIVDGRPKNSQASKH